MVTSPQALFGPWYRRRSASRPPPPSTGSPIQGSKPQSGWLPASSAGPVSASMSGGTHNGASAVKNQKYTPRSSCSSSHRRSPPPFRTPPCRSGRATSTVFWLLLSFHNRRLNHTLARSNSSQQYHRRRLRISSLLWLDSTVRCSLCHYIRQGGTVHFQPVVRPLLHPGHLPREDDCIPPAIKRVG